ncbi:LysR family transcriptional regulator [Pseudomonas sp. KNUC1026]|uniref:LysR family transcriptional regulator n=1 Tax=Pseudomonas sp. KNUC1026 TaxID=2893890 RepID=UPI001F266234|nr:LysR family transcriptional regulator [Pseudomonas sp. KNUC1026]UFH49634.1 LysR family transcriptional regulator [Pseudomonas sp. KNUC1026]
MAINFKIDELRAFRLVVDNRAFGKAATQLNLSQSAVSQKISSLEERIGTLLLDRNSRCAPTEAGKIVYKYAVSIDASVQGAEAELAHALNEQKPWLKVAIASSSPKPMMLEPLYATLRQHPDLNVGIRTIPGREVIYAIIDESYDVGFGPFQKNMGRFLTVPMYRENRFLVASRGHPHLEALASGNVPILKQCSLVSTYLDKTEDRPYPEKIRFFFKNVWEVNDTDMRSQIMDQGLAVGYVSDEVLSGPVGEHFVRLERYDFYHLVREGGVFHLRDRLLPVVTQRLIERLTLSRREE